MRKCSHSSKRTSTRLSRQVRTSSISRRPTSSPERVPTASKESRQRQLGNLKSQSNSPRNALTFTTALCDELQLDLDNDERVNHFWRAWNLLRLRGWIRRWSLRTTVSKSGHMHIYIHMDIPRSFETRIALQVALGSDPMRELQSLMRVWNGAPHPILLHEVKDEKR